MKKLNLSLTTIVATATIASSTVLSLGSLTAVFAESGSASSPATSEKATSSLDKLLPSPSLATATVGMSAGVGLLVAGLLYKSRRTRKNHSGRQVDRFQEEFLCGPLADIYASKREQYPEFPNSDESRSHSRYQEVATESKETPVALPTSEERSANVDTPLKPFDYQALIDKIVENILKGQIRSKDHVYQLLLENVSTGTGEIFERCLDAQLVTTQFQLDTETDSLKKAKKSRIFKCKPQKTR